VDAPQGHSEADPEPRGEDRPLIDQPYHDDVTGVARLIDVGVGQRAIGVGCGRQADRGKSRKGANVHIEFPAIEHDGEATAYMVLNCAALQAEFCACPVMIWRAAFAVAV
jgi:hypothetical protein